MPRAPAPAPGLEEGAVEQLHGHRPRLRQEAEGTFVGECQYRLGVPAFGFLFRRTHVHQTLADPDAAHKVKVRFQQLEKSQMLTYPLSF